MDEPTDNYFTRRTKVIGTSQEAGALELLPKGTKCFIDRNRLSSNFVVELPTGKRIAKANSSIRAWREAKNWWLDNENSDFSQITTRKKKTYKKK